MAAVPVSHSHTTRTRQELNDTILRHGWPAPESPYHHLIQAEATARRLVHIGHLPGLLLHMGALAVLQEALHTPQSVAATRNRVHIGRKALAAARLADPSDHFTAEAFVDTTTFDQLRRLAPGHVHMQAQEVLKNMNAGWHVRMAERVLDYMPPNTYDMILAGNPLTPDAVYWESDNEHDVPHDTWDDSAAARVAAATIYDNVRALAMSVEETREMLEHIE